MTAVAGLAGIGKTELVVQAAEAFTDCGDPETGAVLAEWDPGQDPVPWTVAPP